MVTTAQTVGTGRTRRAPGGERHQLLVALLAILLPVVQVVMSLEGSTFTGPMDLFEMALDGGTALAFGVVVVCFGCLSLTWRLNHHFASLTRVRGDIRRDLLRRAVRNATVVGVTFFLLVMVAAVVCFEALPRSGLVEFRPESVLNPDGSPFTPEQFRGYVLTTNTWSFLYAHGWLPFAAPFALFVGVAAGLWATVGFLLVLLLPHRHVALALPFLIINLVDFALQVLGLPQFSPLLAVFPFSLTPQPLWPSFTSLGVLALLAAGLAAHCWQRVDHLESLA